jgi:hypothetical protein
MRAKKITSRQSASLFELIKKIEPQTESLSIYQLSLREVISQAIRKCNLSRYHIVAKMSEELEIDITKSMLDSWTAESKDGHRFPCEYLPAFCRAVGNNDAILWLVHQVGAYLIGSKEIYELELGKIQQIKMELGEREREIKRMLVDEK